MSWVKSIVMEYKKQTHRCQSMYALVCLSETVQSCATGGGGSVAE